MPLRPSSGAWAPITLHPNFVPTGGTFLAPAYRRDSFGIVYLRGRFSYVGGSPGGFAQFFTLPTGFRPTGTYRYLLTVTSSVGEVYTLCADLKANGSMDYVAGGIGNYSIALDQIFFSTY